MKASLEIEQYTIATILKYSDALAEVPSNVDHSFYENAIHSMAFRAIKQRQTNKQGVTAVIIAESLKSQGFRAQEGIDIVDYLMSLELKSLSKKAGLDYFKELCQINVRRQIYKIGKEIQNLAKNNPDLDESEMLRLATEIFNDQVSLSNRNLEPIDLYEGMIEAFEERAANPLEEYGLVIPYPTFNRQNGGLVNKEVWAIAARPGVGKSCMSKDMTNKIALRDDHVRILDIDTEMSTEAIRYRNGAARLGIPLWFLRTGKYAKNKVFKELFERNKHILEKLKGKVSHIHVPNVHIDDVITMARRWRYGKVKGSEQPIIIYDYLKLTGEISRNQQEYQLIGEKLNKLKELANELDCPLITACQLNRSAEDGRDDSSAIAQSDRLQWFAGYVGILRRKRPEEISFEGGEYGTHNLIDLKTRDQGEEAKGHDTFLKIPQTLPAKTPGGKQKTIMMNVQNYISFDIQNFDVTDKGSLSDIIKAKGHLDISDEDEQGARELSF